MDRPHHKSPPSNILDDAAAFAHPPAGGPFTRWVVGAGLAAIPVLYGVLSLRRGRTTLLGRGSSETLTHEAGRWLAIAYIAAGVFLHFHWFWGSSPRLRPFSYAGKLVALLVFVPSFLYALYRMFVYV